MVLVEIRKILLFAIMPGLVMRHMSYVFMRELTRGLTAGINSAYQGVYKDSYQGVYKKNMENHVLGFFMKNIVFQTYPGIVEYKHTV